jgi:hypothetical protein
MVKCEGAHLQQNMKNGTNCHTRPRRRALSLNRIRKGEGHCQQDPSIPAPQPIAKNTPFPSKTQGALNLGYFFWKKRKHPPSASNHQPEKRENLK